MNYEQTQEALLRAIDSLKPDIDSHDLSLLSGAIGVIHSETEKVDNRIARAIMLVTDAMARVNNTRGFKYGLSLSAKAIRTMPPIVELIHEAIPGERLTVTNGKPSVYDCQILDLKELRK